MNVDQEILTAAKSGPLMGNLTRKEQLYLYDKLRYLIGFPVAKDPDEKAKLAGALATTFSGWRMAEILTAVRLAMGNYLGSSIEVYGQCLTANHIRDLMREYGMRKGELITKYRTPELPEGEIPKEEKDALMIEAINHKFKRFLSDPQTLFDENHVWHHLTNFMQQRGLIQVTPEALEGFKEHATDLAKRMSANRTAKVVAYFDRAKEAADLVESLKERYAHYYIINQYFETLKNDGRSQVL